MKISYHSFETKHARGGALFFYSEVTRLLNELSNPDVVTQPHDFYDIIRQGKPGGQALMASLDKADVLVSNIGPYAHLYHLLREQYGGEFRIVRDVRTSSWAGFLLQEAVAGPLTREGDLVLFPSEFCRQYYLALFPDSLTEENTVVCYPLSDSFPQNYPRTEPDPGFNIGYFGRMGDDKNFDQVLKVFVRLARENGEKVNLHLAGAIDRMSTFGTVRKMRRYIRRHGVSADRLFYHGFLPYQGIWQFLSALDVFVFPAIASVESLGRVLLEAQYVGVPTVAAHYAAASEILPHKNLVPPIFKTQQPMRAIDSCSLGRVCEEALLSAIEKAQVGEPAVLQTPYQPQTYIDLVTGGIRPNSSAPLSGTTRAFIDSVKMSGLNLQADGRDFKRMSETLFASYRNYNDNRFFSRLNGFLASIPAFRTYPRRRGLYLNRLIKPSAQFELGHAREHCWSIGFDPTIVIDDTLLKQDPFTGRVAA